MVAQLLSARKEFEHKQRSSSSSSSGKDASRDPELDQFMVSVIQLFVLLNMRFVVSKLGLELLCV